ncbi:MAG: ABC transporter ATP-binding protein [Candidatus Eremiobacteraeota bacterium]|nr:ABC transporter ATP-binding protein [Candidatus Eremiobacteraeota bacterium]
MNDDSTPAIDLRDIHKTYENGALKVPVLHGISFTIDRGEYVAIMGPSGSGKSTLMNLIGCLDRPTTGDYVLDGVDVSKLDDNALADLRLRKLGFVFQGFNLLARTDALRNVALPLFYAGVPAKRRLEQAHRALEAVGIGERADHQPSQLSGGEQQRVAIARALVNDPAVLLADEPTGNLDSKTGDEIMRLFSQLHAGGRTIIMVTHDERIAANARRTIRLLDGLVVADAATVPAG